MADDLNKKNSKEEAARFLQAEILRLEAKTKGLEADKAALIQEYVLATDEEAPEKLKKSIRGRIPLALDVIDELLATGSDAIRASTAKWIVDRGLTPDVLGGTDPASKELAKLLEKLKAND